MNRRQQIAETLLMPADRTLGAVIDLFEKYGALESASDGTYRFLKKVLGLQFELRNELEVQGAENVPSDGGVVLASNHQSWLDAPAIGVACPRRVHYIAKAEFRDWPVLRHMVPFMQGVFVKRGGDEKGLEAIVEALEEGKALVIFPEGTIPGEEDLPRDTVERQTGLLQGKTGAVRLALKARVPIVPVGISGTGRAFPPEVYPRLELLRLPAAKPIRVRFGSPIDLTAYQGRELDRGQLRELTDDLMARISGLIDHRDNYVPISSIPISMPPPDPNLAVLVLHGFTASKDAVDGLLPYLEREQIPYERPILRGHGTRYQDLRGVKARDWYIDAERALIKLWNRGHKCIVVGHSMGGLVALELAMRHPELVEGVVAVAAAIQFKNRFSELSPMISLVKRYWPSPQTFNDLTLASRSTNYPKFATDAFASLYHYSRKITARLPEVHVPIRILQSKQDQVIAPESANTIYERVSSRVREIRWFERSGHEMMQDLEREAVFQEIMNFVHELRAQPKAGQTPQ
jgi:carboxylesterase